MQKWWAEIRKTLIDDRKNKKILGLATFGILGVVSVVMTVMNIFTHKGALTLATGIFAVLCAVNIVLALRGDKGVSASMVLFAVEILVLFSFFLVSGNPEGFSAIWICMLPLMGMLFFGRKQATLLCAIMVLILMFFLWTDIGNSFLQYAYTESFKMRFPVLFASFFVLSFFHETLRASAYAEMMRLQQLYHDLSVRDPLTGALNRQGMYNAMEEDPRYSEAQKLGIAMFDIDFFKAVNDTYGHNAGDVVLEGFAREMQQLDALLCRWGGEEFVLIYTDDDVSMGDLEQLRQSIEQRVFEFEGQEIRITISCGLLEIAHADIHHLDRLIEKADSALYRAKESGRNRIVWYED